MSSELHKRRSCFLSSTGIDKTISELQNKTAVQYFGTAIFRRYRSSVSCETMCELTSYVCRPSWWILSLCCVMPLPVWGVEALYFRSWWIIEMPVWGVEALYFRSWWIIEMPVILTLSCIINQCSSSLTLHRARFLEEFDTLEFESCVRLLRERLIWKKRFLFQVKEMINDLLKSSLFEGSFCFITESMNINNVSWKN